MNEPSSPFRLFDRWRRRADEALLSEPADVGTAFGLELSMLPDDESAAGGAGVAQNTVWWRRLIRSGAN